MKQLNMNPITEGETEEEHHVEMKEKPKQEKGEQKKKTNQVLTPSETETK